MNKNGIPERLVGYLKYKRRQYAFEYRESESKLYLYTTKTDISNNDFYDWLTNKDDIVESPKWVNEIQLKGVSADNRQVVFGVLERESKYHGFISLDVRWLIYYRRYTLKDISGFAAEGSIVDSYFQPRNALRTIVKYKKDHRVDEISSTSQTTDLIHCGSYSINKGVKVETAVREYAGTSPKNVETPIYARSRLEATFSKNVNIDILLRAISNQNKFLQYVFYSKDATIKDYSVFALTSNSLKDYFGTIRLSPYDGIKPSEEKRKKVIACEILNGRQSLILDAIQNGRISLTYLCETEDERHRYSPERVMMIFSEFEREFRNIYGVDAGRHEKYCEMKAAISGEIATLMESKQGKERRYIKRIKDQFDEMDQPYDYKVKYAIDDCLPILEKTLMIHYRAKDSNTISGISNRMGKMRNGIAHSNPDFVIDPIHLQDIGVMERLIYIIRLKNIGLEDEAVRKATECIFGN